MYLFNGLNEYIEEKNAELVSLLTELCKIPAPSHHEEKRARFCLEWFKQNCCDNVHMDEALNVICQYGNENADKTIIFMAHTDTVFPDTEPMPQKIENGRLYCPGAGDDTANLAIMMLAARYLFENKVSTEYRVLFVANSCEEGLGNLKGARQLFDTYGDTVRAVISFDLDTNTIINRAVGSHRYMVSVMTEGGHSFANFGRVNAISVASRIIDKLYAQRVPDISGTKTTYNVGTIEGGTSVNTIAPVCRFTYEYRSDMGSNLLIMKKSFEDILGSFVSDDYNVTAELIGDRPGMEEPKDPKSSAKLLSIVESTLVAVIGKAPKHSSGSTDCNIPMSRGITSICMGLARMSGAHTRGEYVELDSLGVGLEIAVRVIAHVISKDIW